MSCCYHAVDAADADYAPLFFFFFAAATLFFEIREHDVTPKAIYYAAHADTLLIMSQHTIRPHVTPAIFSCRLAILLPLSAPLLLLMILLITLFMPYAIFQPFIAAADAAIRAIFFS